MWNTRSKKRQSSDASLTGRVAGLVGGPVRWLIGGLVGGLVGGLIGGLGSDVAGVVVVVVVDVRVAAARRRRVGRRAVGTGWRAVRAHRGPVAAWQIAFSRRFLPASKTRSISDTM